MYKQQDSPSAAVIMRVFKRDKFTCNYCGVNGSEAELQCDHIIPKSKGGSNHISNLTTACRKCNQSKGNRNTMQVNTNTKGYYFRYIDYTYKVESFELNGLWATIIDPSFEEYETIYLPNIDLSKIKFFQDKVKFLAWLWGNEDEAVEWVENLTKEV